MLHMKGEILQKLLFFLIGKARELNNVLYNILAVIIYVLRVGLKV